MSFQPQLVALDIDGTLVDWSGRMPDDVRAAVRRVVDAGVPVVLSTGRSWWSTRPIFEQLDLPDGWAICSNGAVGLRHAPTDVVFEERFDPTVTLQKVADVAPDICVAIERGLTRVANRPFPEGEMEGPLEFASLEEMSAAPVCRIVLRDPNNEQAIFEDMVRQLGLHGVSYFVGWSAWLDIAPFGVDKSHGLKRVCEDLGIDPSNVLAIGDGNNDIDMLAWAGRGVALGDAGPAVQASADHVTAKFLDGGTVEELRRWF
ncbi:HAD family hydrolase [Tessaracoccus caeni]|uniref:HAD family hydrolase n=1 Tax=Tessaracoccus caeni TaxID=3031239 RepID=UPI0023DB1408|nr:HAD family hydrolase [Tessaracoccus caeni]MDF1489927.1 HAD family hydrolase [Tessaracoccus caeni]